MLAPKVFEVVVQKNVRFITPHHPPLPAFTEEPQPSAKSSNTTSVCALEVLPGSAFGASNCSLFIMSDQKYGALQSITEQEDNMKVVGVKVHMYENVLFIDVGTAVMHYPNAGL